jgi:hypothetical protein
MNSILTDPSVRAANDLMEDKMPSRSLCTTSVLAIVLVIGLISCSGGGGSPIMPGVAGTDEGITSSLVTQSSGFITQQDHALWGLYYMHLNADHTGIAVEPVREAQFHLNVVGYLQNPPGTNNLIISNVSVSDTGTLLVDIFLKHPFPGKVNLTGFDVRGIAILPGEKQFISTIIPDVDEPDGVSAFASRRLVNADGYTSLWNRWTAQEVYHPQIFGYIKGKFATPDEYYIQGNLHGFKAFWTGGDGLEFRHAFEPGQGSTRNYEFDFPPGPLTFAYAVDVCWEPPINLPATSIDDFPITANCDEPFHISVSIVSNSLTKIAGSATIQFDVSDWQDATAFSNVYVESPDLFFNTIDPGPPIGFPGPNTARYQVTVPNTRGDAITTGGGSDLLIVVEDMANSTVNPDLTAYQIVKIPVADVPGFWRDRDGDSTWVNVPIALPLMQPSSLSSGQPDLAIVSYPGNECEIFNGEPELMLFDDVNEQFMVLDRMLDSTEPKSGYPIATSPPSWLLYPHCMDSTNTGWYGVGSTSEVGVSGTSYEVKNIVNMFTQCGIYGKSWHSGTMDGSPNEYLETVRDVTNGQGNLTGDPLFGLLAFESGTMPSVAHILSVGFPYVGPTSNTFRGEIPMLNAGNVPGAIDPGAERLRCGIDTDCKQELGTNHYAFYVAECNPTAGNSELELFDTNVQALPVNSLWTVTNAMINANWPGAYAIDCEVVPSKTNEVTIMGEDKAEYNWFCVLMGDGNDYWLAFYDPLNPSPDSPGNDPTLPIYVSTNAPYLGGNFRPVAMDIDYQNFEAYVLSIDDLDNYYVTVFEYFY